jgi:[protein-PII] uridylyltransferase
LIPEWEPIRAFPQRDLYHRFTVDHHLFTAVAELAASRSLDERDLRDAWSHVGDPDALFLAALFHDVGKGRGGDHSVVGAEIARACAERIGLSATQVSDVSFLVEEHLTLAETAVRRDLNEPHTIAETAARMGDQRKLAMLYLLTRADSLATGAEAWSSFRASLVRELYGRTSAYLAGVPVEEIASGPAAMRELATALELTPDDAASLLGPMPESWAVGIDVEAARRQLALLRTPLAPDEVRTAVRHTNEADEFIVVTPDRPGLFSTVAGVLALRGLDVHDAEIYTRGDGIAVEVFRVVGAHGPISDERWTKLGDDIAAASRGDIDLDDALLKKAAQTRRRRGQRRSALPWRVVVTNDASKTHTVIEVHTTDRVGLLRAVTKALADAGCDLGLAKIATYGVEVVDVFYVRDLEGAKITDPDRIAAIEQRLGAVLDT